MQGLSPYEEERAVIHGAAGPLGLFPGVRGRAHGPRPPFRGVRRAAPRGLRDPAPPIPGLLGRGRGGVRALLRHGRPVRRLRSPAVMAVIVLIFIRGELFSSRFIVLAAWLLALAFVTIGRVAVRFFQRLLLRGGIGIHKVALVGGDDRTTVLLMGEFSRHPAMG